eukprot:TRINITY_DN8401_c0_g1_i2.p1 TRINITY_DN8401_c0_g1~~TRINITY_DN8401_c0_g1_i2.p1  ORF type:complete len:621 (+),score=61.13 TRINITY_DN8401_c0_g1_i2:445-2307(+)
MQTATQDSTEPTSSHCVFANIRRMEIFCFLCRGENLKPTQSEVKEALEVCFAVNALTAVGHVKTDRECLEGKCLSCGILIKGHSPRYTCCFESTLHDFCQRCVTTKGTDLHDHPLTFERYHPATMPLLVVGSCIGTTLSRTFGCYAFRPCLGVRSHAYPNRAPCFSCDGFDWFTFGWMYERCMIVGSRLRGLPGIVVGDHLAILDQNTLEFYITYWACFFVGLVPVSLDTGFDDATLIHVLSTFNICIVVCNRESEVRLKQSILHRLGSPPQHILCTAELTLGTTYGFTNLVPVCCRKGADIVAIVCTSGSTGFPKPVFFTDSSFNKQMRQMLLSGMAGSQNCSVSWSLSDRCNSIFNIILGDRIAISEFHEKGVGWTGLLQDFQLVKPTFIVSIPKLWNLLYGRYKAEVWKNTTTLGLSSEEAVKSSLQTMSSVLGNRLRQIVCGGSSISSDVLDFLRHCFKCRVSNLYGTTETGAIASDNQIRSGVIFKLSPWEEYRPTDWPNPRGELWIKKTNKSSSDDWVQTGDIVELYGNRMINIIDRKTNIIKLAQGEFVCPEKLENLFIKSPLVSHVFIHADPLQAYLIAVAFPNEYHGFSPELKVEEAILKDFLRLVQPMVC